MNIAVCEDNAADSEAICGFLREHFEKNGYIGDIHTYDSGEALLAAFSSCKYDAVFLDIYMSGMTGMETARKMRESDPGFSLVFITGSEQHAMEAYSLRACAYVPKPIKPDAMDIAFKQCQSVFLKNARCIEIVTDRMNVKIPLANIHYIEVYGRDVLFHTNIKILRTYMPLEQIEQRFGMPFLRCHRSYLVNMNHIASLREQDILMTSGDVIPIRQRGRSEIREAYSEFLSRRLFEVNT